MKPILFAFAFFVCCVSSLQAQNKDIEAEIRSLENAEADAVLRHDSVTLEKIWAADFTVNNPLNTVRSWKKGDPLNLYYSSFERNMEKFLMCDDNTVITMGNEVVVPKAPMPRAGETLKRRYTHIWLKRNGVWQLAGRHANVICPSAP